MSGAIDFYTMTRNDLNYLLSEKDLSPVRHVIYYKCRINEAI